MHQLFYYFCNMTGVEFNQQLDLVIDRPYSRYWSPPQRNDLVRMAITEAITNRTKNNDSIISQDMIFGIYKSNAVFTPTTNTLSLIEAGTGIPDYFHMMNVRTKYLVPVTPVVGVSIYIAEATQTTPARIKLNNNSNLRTGNQVLVSGLTVNTNCNGTRYLKQISPKWYELYADQSLLTPIIGNGTYVGTSGTIQLISYNYAKLLDSNHKFSKLGEATVDNPMYEIADTTVKLYPLSRACSEVTVDYVSTPVYIDVEDAVTNLNDTYSQSFLDLIMQFTAVKMGMASRDNELTNNAVITINQA